MTLISTGDEIARLYLMCGALLAMLKPALVPLSMTGIIPPDVPGKLDEFYAEMGKYAKLDPAEIVILEIGVNPWSYKIQTGNQAILMSLIGMMESPPNQSETPTPLLSPFASVSSARPEAEKPYI